MKKREFTLESRFEDVASVCKKSMEFCEQQIDVPKICNEAEICLIEALNNIIKHSYGGDPGNIINVEISIDQNAIVIVLSDTGISRTNFDKPKLNFNPDILDEVPESGMGLFIIDKLMSETSYSTSNGVNRFTMKKYF